MDWIHLRRARVDCIIGILEHERRTPQPLLVSVSLGLSLSTAARGDLRDAIDYSALLGQVRFLAEKGEWGLIESLAAAVLRFVLRRAPGDPAPRPSRARVVVTKPGALSGQAIPSVEMRAVSRGAPAERRRLARNVSADVLAETADAGAYCIDLAPQATWSAPGSVSMLVVSGSVAADGLRFGPAEQVDRGSSIVAGDQRASLLVVARPPIPATASGEGVRRR
jgi:dihydroneopterin aldolase